MKRARSAISIVTVVVLLTGLFAGGVGGTPPQGDTSGGDYTIDELAEGGAQEAARAPSFRWISRTSGIWIDVDRTNPIKDFANPDRPYFAEVLLEPGMVVEQDELRLHYQGPRDAGNQSYTFHVVYWEVGSQEVERNGTVVTERAATNVTHETKTVTFAGSSGVETLDLRSHYDRTVHVTMWIEGVDGARWVFRHHTLETNQEVPIETTGDRLWWLLKDFVVWLLVLGMLGAAGSLWAHRRAGAGPQMGMLAWGFLLSIGGFFGLLYGYEGFATLFARAPKVLAALTVGLLLIPLLEGQDDRLKTIEFVKPVVTDAVSTAGEKAYDVVRIEEEREKVTEMPDGRLAVVKPGLFKFIARLFGGAAELRGANELVKTRVDASGGSKTDEYVWCHWQSDEVVDYEPEGFELNLTLPRIAAALFASITTTYAVTMAAGPGMAWIGGLVAIPAVVSVKNGHAEVWPAPAHARPAHITMMLGSKEFKDADTLEESRRQTYTERAKSSKEVEEVVQSRDDTLIAEMHGSDVAATVRDRDDLDHELPDRDPETGADDADVDLDDDEDDGSLFSGGIL